VDDPAEVLAEVACGAKAAFFGHSLDRKVTCLEQPLREWRTSRRAVREAIEQFDPSICPQSSA